MANCVLVHGAWGGHHTWGEVPERLRAAGHEMLTCTLPGLGSRQGELHPGITLTDHIDDVCAQIEAAGFERFILAGHSYGGMVITAVASQLGARIDAISYVDAFLPESDQSLWDITGPFEHDWYINTQRHKPGYVDPIGVADFVTEPGVVGYHPLLTLTEAIPLSGAEKAIPRKSYIFATGYQPTAFPRFAEKAQAAGWNYQEVECDHFVMQNKPEESVAVLLGLAG